jgi:hypothetical protein
LFGLLKLMSEIFLDLSGKVIRQVKQSTRPSVELVFCYAFILQFCQIQIIIMKPQMGALIGNDADCRLVKRCQITSSQRMETSCQALPR